MKLIFRDLNQSLVSAMQAAFSNVDADIEHNHIFAENVRADAVISPANCIGRMDGGIDAVYIQKFGWQLQARLSHHLIQNHGGLDRFERYNGSTGRIQIGEATIISTNAEDIRFMIMAPTMDWPPGSVKNTENAYFAFLAALRLANNLDLKTVLTPGLGTLTGKLAPEKAAKQMRNAWDMVNDPLHVHSLPFTEN